jgi:uncharacterized HAD superfamily protein
MSTYVIDIDGVIADKKTWTFEDSRKRYKKMLMNIKPIIPTINKINTLYDKKNIIILHTSRLWLDYEVTVKWLKKYNVKYHTLVMAKPIGNYYVDDHNLTVEEFLK